LIQGEKIAQASCILGLVSLAMPWWYANSPALRVTGWLLFYYERVEGMYGSSSMIKAPDPYYLIHDILTALLVFVGSLLILSSKQSVLLRRVGSLALLGAPFYFLIPSLKLGVPLVSPQTAQFYLGSILALVAGAMGMMASTRVFERSTDIASKDVIAGTPELMKEQEVRLSQEAMETIRRYNTYLVRLDDLLAKAAINEQAFLKLRGKYEKKIRRTIESGAVPSTKRRALSKTAGQADDAEM
jgi:hypothetical protein